jgi:uncharacterized membrane protein
MKRFRDFAVSAFVSGLLIIVPVYLTILLFAKAMQSVVHLVRPLAGLLPDWLPAEQLLSLLVVLILCFLVGTVARTAAGHAIQDRVEKSLIQKLPGYALLRSFTQQLAGRRDEHVWKPALAEIEDALTPAFIIEEFEDGRFTVFVPAAPTPFTGSIYILIPERVHPVDVPFSLAIKTIARWGCGSKELVAAMKPKDPYLKKRAS